MAPQQRRVVRAAQGVFVRYVAKHDGHDVGVRLGKAARGLVLHILALFEYGADQLSLFRGNLAQVSVYYVGYRHNADVCFQRDILECYHNAAPLPQINLLYLF